MNSSLEGKKPTIVLVDDNPDVLETMSEAISDWLPGHEVITTSLRFQSPQYQAIEITNKLTEPTLFLVDLHMPGRNGLELIEDIRSHALVQVEFLLVTGDDTEEVHALANSMGVDTFYKFEPTKRGTVGREYHFGKRFAAKIQLAIGHLANAVKLSTDRKTGAYTFDGLEEQWVQAWNRMKRDKLWAVCLFIDVNDFKLVNDRFSGHEPGDVVLRAIKEAIHRHLRKTDLIGRQGDEFVVILLMEINPLRGDGRKKTPQEMEAEVRKQVSEIVNRTRAEVDILKVEAVPGEIVATSISVGIEIINPGTLRNNPSGSPDIPLEDFKAILKKADSLTYRDKLAHYERLLGSEDDAIRKRAQAKVAYYRGFKILATH